MEGLRIVMEIISLTSNLSGIIIMITSLTTFTSLLRVRNLETSIEAAFSTMLKRASSGTAASVLASGEGRGANLLQAVVLSEARLWQ